jgi:putative ABC transport system permease protein
MKKWFEPLSTAFVGVVTHKLRSFLTILGIVIGVAAVIALMSVGRGATADILSRIETLGSDVVIIRAGTMSFGGVSGTGGTANTLTMEDATAINEQVSNISAVAPFYSRNLQVVVGGENLNSSVLGVTPEYMDVLNLELTNGTFFNDYDYQRGSKLAVLGANVAETLFGTTNPIGQQIRIGSIVVRITGVLQSKGGTFGSPDDSIFIPLTAMQQTVAQPRTAQGDHVVSSIYLAVGDEEMADVTVTDLANLLRDRHNLGSGVDDDFIITSMEEIASAISETANTMTYLLGAIAAISLLVGGIGVMNIMLVSVLERTREIGIRKALGAKERDIWSQFLIEAALLTLVGGIIGTAVGLIVSYLINQSGFVSTLVTADIIILAVSVSVGIGLFFGFYPAWNASRLDPIKALRFE